jgi:acyl-CoA thioester hydrolase
MPADQSTDRLITETTFYVRYYETDQMGIVHHSNYNRWMEEGRSDYMRRRGVNYAEVEKHGHALAVTDVHTRYYAPAHYGERVTVRTWVESLRSRALTFGYEIIEADSTGRLVTGHVQLMLIDRAGRVVTFPADMQTALLGREA